MITKEQLHLVEEEVAVLFKKLEAQATISAASNEDGSISIAIAMDEPQMLIGEAGQTLLEIQHLVRAMLRKKLAEPAWIFLDINEYRKSKETYIKQLAESAADEVALLGKEKELQPMNAQDRRVVHTAISQRKDVVSESRGEGTERRVIIKPVAKLGLSAAD